MPVSIRCGVRGSGPRATDGGRDLVPRVRKDVPAELYGLDPLGFGAHCRGGYAEQEGLLLQTARVGDHSAAGKHRGDQVGVGER
jgi:hypothetical protein